MYISLIREIVRHKTYLSGEKYVKTASDEDMGKNVQKNIKSSVSVIK